MEGLGINLHGLIAQLVNFGLLFLLLWLVAYKPILRMLDERAARVREGIEKAEAIKEQAARAEAEYAARRAEALREAQEIVARANQAAERIQREAEERREPYLRMSCSPRPGRDRRERQRAVADLSHADGRSRHPRRRQGGPVDARPAAALSARRGSAHRGRAREAELDDDHHSAARRYARAVFDIAVERRGLDDWQRDLAVNGGTARDAGRARRSSATRPCRSPPKQRSWSTRLSPAWTGSAEPRLPADRARSPAELPAISPSSSGCCASTQGIAMPRSPPRFRSPRRPRTRCSSGSTH